MKEYLFYTIPIFTVYLAAAIAGFLFLKRAKPNKAIYLFVGLLWFTILIEIIATYPMIGFYSEYEFFGFTKGEVYERNFWLFNLYSIISFIIYIQFFRLYLKVKIQQKIVGYLLIAFVFACIVNICFSGIYFVGFSSFTNIIGTLLLLFTIALYYYQLLTSDAILEIKNSMPFYISIGAILLHIALTPLLIYSKFFSKEANSPEFVELHQNMFQVINLLVYLIYTAGFIICQNKKSS